MDQETTNALHMILGLDVEGEDGPVTFEIDTEYEDTQFLKIWVIPPDETKKERYPVFISKIVLRLAKQPPDGFEMPAPW